MPRVLPEVVLPAADLEAKAQCRYIRPHPATTATIVVHAAPRLTMIRIVLLSALAALGAAQQFNRDPKTAAILTEQRYLSNDGKFGAQYTQEDGVQFKEESDADGTRRGSYSYVDPTGQRRTVSYVAGKNGFQATGDHIPAAPAPVDPLPQYNSPAQPQAQYNPPQAQYGSQSNDDGQWVDDTRQEYPPNSAPQRSWNTAPAPTPAPQQSWNNAPAQATQQSWNSAPTPQQSWNTAPASQRSWNSDPAPQPSWSSNTAPQTFDPAPQASWNSAPTQRWSAPLETTPAPHRFFPPGKLSLNRSPDGFSFTFNKS